MDNKLNLTIVIPTRNRLKLLTKLLCDDGIIFVSIDDNESSNLKLILDEILGQLRLFLDFFFILYKTKRQFYNE